MLPKQAISRDILDHVMAVVTTSNHLKELQVFILCLMGLELVMGPAWWIMIQNSHSHTHSSVYTHTFRQFRVEDLHFGIIIDHAVTDL